MNEASILENLSKLLKELEGTVVARGTRYVPSSGKTRATEPYRIFEDLVGATLEKVAGNVNSIVKEPGGAGQFPDWGFGSSIIEVKSSNSRNKRFMVGAVKTMAEAFSKEDPKYLRAHYVVFYYSLLPNNSLRIDEVSIGRVWNYSKPTAAKSGRRPQWPSSRAGLDSPQKWTECYFENTSKRGFPVPRDSIDAALRKISVETEEERFPLVKSGSLTLFST